MATVNDLRKSILEIPDEEAFEIIRAIRFARRASAKTPTRKKTTRSPKKLDVRSMVKTMNAEQREKLLKELGG